MAEICKSACDSRMCILLNALFLKVNFVWRKGRVVTTCTFVD